MDDANRFEMGAMIRGLAWDVGLPLVAYYVLHLLGANDWVALLAASVAAVVRIAWGAARSRRLNLFATVMLLVFGIGLALSFVAGDPRFLLLKSSFVTSAVGLTFLVTAIRGDRPLTLAAQQAWNPGRAEELAAEYRDEPEARRAYRVSSAVWGLGLLVEAVVRIPLIYLLPISVMVGLSTALMIVTFVALTAWTAFYVRNLEQKKKQNAGIDAAGRPNVAR